MNGKRACDKPAEWELHESDDPYSITYSCTEHLCEMLADNTVEIFAVRDSRDRCCYDPVICPKCGASVMISYESVSDTEVVWTCHCGNTWHEVYEDGIAEIA